MELVDYFTTRYGIFCRTYDLFDTCRPSLRSYPTNPNPLFFCFAQLLPSLRMLKGGFGALIVRLIDFVLALQ